MVALVASKLSPFETRGLRCTVPEFRRAVESGAQTVRHAILARGILLGDTLAACVCGSNNYGGTDGKQLVKFLGVETHCETRYQFRTNQSMVKRTIAWILVPKNDALRGE